MTTKVRVVAFGIRGLDHVEGGIETHARELYPRLSDLGLDVCVLVRRAHAGQAGSWDPRGVRVRALMAPRGKGIEAFGHAMVCTAYCLKARPDVVHIHGIAPGAFAPILRTCGLRVVVTHHGHDYQATKWGAFARISLRIAERWSVRGASAVVAVSRSIADAVARSFGVEPVVICNGVPRWPASDGYRPAPAIQELATCPFLLVVGRLTAHKRVLDVIEALHATKPASIRGQSLRVVVCGDRATPDPYAARIEHAARQDSDVVLAGHVDSADLGWLLRRAVGLVMASSYEGMPIAVLEAMSAGCPVIVSDIPAHVELGLPPDQYFSVGDVPGLVARLQTLLGSDREEAIAVQSRRVTEGRFDWDRIALATARVLSEDPATRRGRPPRTKHIEGDGERPPVREGMP